jgi:hypothetical protein
MAMVSWRPDRYVAGAWRGARVTAADELTVTVSVRAEQSYVQTYVISRSLYPSPVVNGAIVVRIVNEGAPIPDYAIAEVRAARFVGRIEHSTERPNWGHVEYALTGEEPYYWREGE